MSRVPQPDGQPGRTPPAAAPGSSLAWPDPARGAHAREARRLRTGEPEPAPELAELSTGQRVAAFRRLRGLTQADLAQRMHRSDSWVTKIERGERRLDSIAVMEELARALAVSFFQLTGTDDAGLAAARPSRATRLEELRQVLSRPAIVLPRDSEPAPVEELQRDVVEVRRRYHHTPHNLSAVPGDLARLIRVGQTAVHTAPAADRPGAYAALSEVYQLGAQVLRHSGDSANARVAIDRAMAAAEQSGDLRRVGSVGSFLALNLLYQGEYDDAVASAMAIADLLARDPLAGTAEGVVVLGALHNYAGYIAAHSGDRAESRQLLKAAHIGAERLRQDQGVYGVFFGPANLLTVEHGVLAAFGQPQAAVRLGERIPAADGVASLGSVPRAGIHALFLTRAYSMTGRQDEALATLASGIRVAPEILGEHPLAREIVREALHGRQRVGEQLRRLAQDVGVLD